MTQTPLMPGTFYHLYNRGINACDLFQENDNYEYFLHLFDKHISPVADTFAWALMPNHFHLLVRIKSHKELNLQGFKNLEGLSGSGRNRINQQFSNLFNAYSKAFNKRYQRTGSLFEHPFRRIPVESLNYLKYLVYYIHHNPIHHGFCDDFTGYPWTSYLSMLSPKTTKMKRSEVLSWFNDENEFKGYHSQTRIDKYDEMSINFFKHTVIND